MIGISSVALTLLGTMAGGGEGDQSLSMLQAIYGQTAGGAMRGDPIAALADAQKNSARDIARTEREPEVARDISRFESAIAGADEAAGLLKNPDFLKVLLTANGLGDQAAYPALAQKVLLSDPADRHSLVARLANASWTATNKTYRFGTEGLAVIRDPAVQQKLADAYAEVRWRESLDKKTAGLSNALTFRAEAATVKSPYDILGDKVLREVVTVALGLPPQIAIQPVETQAREITSRLDLSKFEDSRFVDALTQRYLLAKQDAAASDSGPSLDALAAQASGLWV